MKQIHLARTGESTKVGDEVLTMCGLFKDVVAPGTKSKYACRECFEALLAQVDENRDAVTTLLAALAKVHTLSDIAAVIAEEALAKVSIS